MRLHQKPFKYWWISLLAGILSIVGGILCFSTPIDSLAVLTLFFVAILIVGGIFNIASAFTNRKWNDYWGWDLARGIIELLLGVWLYMLPLVLVTTTIVYVFGFWMLFHSIIGICESCELARLPIKGWGWLLACNILSLICSFLFLTTLSLADCLFSSTSGYRSFCMEYSVSYWHLRCTASTAPCKKNRLSIIL